MSGLEENLKIVSPPPPAEEDVIALKLLDLGKTISSWTSYSFGNDFMNANTSWNFQVADDSLFNLIDKIQCGQRIAVTVNGAVVATGYLDQIVITSSKHGGTILEIRGRDALGPMCDACIDPKFLFDGLQTPVDVIKKLAAPFGFTDVKAQDFVNAEKLTGVSNILSVDDSGKNIVTKNITSPMNSKFKPHPGEGVYAFCERLGRRFGYHIWSSVDGKYLIVGTPTFNSKPIYYLSHTNALTNENAKNLALESQMIVDWTRQPSVIIGEGHGGGGHFRKQSLKVIMVNELLADENGAEIVALKNQYKEARVLDYRHNKIKRPAFIKLPAFVKPIFVHDDSSANKDQLGYFVKRMMAEYQSQFLVMRYTVNRHTQLYNGQKAVWAPNSMVYVDDYVNNIHGNMWIKSRTFTKDREGGTKTSIECILPYTLELSPLNE